MVPVEARVHPAELGQAHRDVPVVEDDRDAVPPAQVRRNATEMGHRHGKDDDRIRALLLDQSVEVLLPPRRHPAPDGLARHAPAEAVLGIVLGTTQVRVALHTCDGVADTGERLTLEVGRVRGCSPPGRLDRPAAVGGDDEVGTFLVEALPQLPPRRGAAVPKVEIDRGGDGEDPGRTHPTSLSEPDYGAVRLGGIHPDRTMAPDRGVTTLLA